MTNPYLVPKGTIFVGLNGGSALSAIAVGSNGFVMKADSTQANGIGWQAPNVVNTVYPTGDYTVLTTDNLVYATTSAARAITLPTAPPEGFSVTIKDVTGTANANNITVAGAVNINGSATFVMDASFQAQKFTYSATNSKWYTT